MQIYYNHPQIHIWLATQVLSQRGPDGGNTNNNNDKTILMKKNNNNNIILFLNIIYVNEGWYIEEYMIVILNINLTFILS